MVFKFLTVKVDTVLGENDELDRSFFEYLDEYSISYKVLENKGGGQWPQVEYTGGPLAIINMLKERFGMEEIEINVMYPEIKQNQGV